MDYPTLNESIPAFKPELIFLTINKKLFSILIVEIFVTLSIEIVN